MTFPALLAALVVSPIQGSQVPFGDPQGVTEPSRLALTPVLDGEIKRDEWDGFAKLESGEAYLQWEPGILYVAGKIPVDQDLVVSIDVKQDGWLVGKDNLEFRLRPVEGKVVVTARQLDATNVAGPKWVDLPGFEGSTLTAMKSDEMGVSIEAAITDPGIGMLPVKEGDRYNVRIDSLAQTSQQLEPFLPRVAKEVKMAMQRASAMPMGLNWKVEDSGRVVTPGKTTKIRFSFNTKEEIPIKKIDIKPEGPLAEQTTSMGIPFPEFDKKGRAFVDYETGTSDQAPTGYHLLSGVLSTADGAPAIIQASFRIAPLVDIDVVAGKFEEKDTEQSIKVPFIIKSNSPNRLDGFFDVDVPKGWEIVRGNEKNFIIYNSRSGVRRVLTLTIPPHTSGVFPFHFKTRIGQQSFEQTGWINIEKK